VEDVVKMNIYEGNSNSMKSTEIKVEIPEDYRAKYEELESLELSDLEISTVKGVIDRTKKANVEYGAAHNGEAAIIDTDGNVRYFTSNLYAKVQIPADISELMDKQENSITLIHCHTNYTPPSPEDFSQLLRAGVSKIIIAGTNNIVYTVEIGDGELPDIGEFREAVNLIRKSTIQEVPEFLGAGDWTAAELNYATIYEQAFEIKQKFKWKMRGGELE